MSWPPCYFSYPHPSTSKRPPGQGWGRLSCSPPSADSPTVRKLSKVVRNRYECLSCTDLLFLHLLLKQFGYPPGSLFWELQVLMRVAWTVLDTPWVDFLIFSHRSFSTLAGILAMEAFVMRFFSGLPLPCQFSLLRLLITAFFCVLFKALSL